MRLTVCSFGGVVFLAIFQFTASDEADRWLEQNNPEIFPFNSQPQMRLTHCQRTFEVLHAIFQFTASDEADLMGSANSLRQNFFQFTASDEADRGAFCRKCL